MRTKASNSAPRSRERTWESEYVVNIFNRSAAQTSSPQRVDRPRRQLLRLDFAPKVLRVCSKRVRAASRLSERLVMRRPAPPGEEATREKTSLVALCCVRIPTRALVRERTRPFSFRCSGIVIQIRCPLVFCETVLRSKGLRYVMCVRLAADQDTDKGIRHPCRGRTKQQESMQSSRLKVRGSKTRRR